MSQERKITQEEINEMLVHYQQYRDQVEALTQQLGVIEMSLSDVERAIATIEGMIGRRKGEESLIPIGAGSFIHSVLTKPETVVLGVGAGVCLEIGADAAKEELVKRREEIERALSDLTKRLSELTGKIQQIQRVLEQVQLAEAQQFQQPMVGQ